LEKGLNAFYAAAAEEMKDAETVALMKNLASIEERHMAQVKEMFLAAEPSACNMRCRCASRPHPNGVFAEVDVRLFSCCPSTTSCA
ncbi:MAG: hypothetical protein P8Y78_06450, partial [Acidihalobacter sp.]